MKNSSALRVEAGLVCGLLFPLLVSVAQAQEYSVEVEPETTRACVRDAIAQGSAPEACLRPAHAHCTQFDPNETPALIALCFDNAHDSWSKALARDLSALDATMEPDAGARLRIEAKYDVLSGLLQCDRIEDLGRLSDVPANQLTIETSRCKATTSGLAFIRLLRRTAAN